MTGPRVMRQLGRMPTRISLMHTKKWAERGSLQSVQVERCSSEPLAGSGKCRTGPDAGAVAIRAPLRQDVISPVDVPDAVEPQPSMPEQPLTRHVPRSARG